MEIFKKKIIYSELNAKQKEIYNYQKVSGILAEYGYTTIKLSDDWMGADFIAIQFTGEEYLKIQLKGRLTFDKKYIKKDIYICFCQESDWYIYPHDILLKKFLNEIEHSSSWKEKGIYHYPYLTEKHKDRLSNFKLMEN
jgi:hypothetical protein